MRYLITIAGLILFLGLLAGLKGAQIATLISFGEQMEKLGAPPEAVNVAAVEQQVWERTLSAVATVVSSRGVALSNDAPGVVSRLHFESGAEVKAGEPLVELDASVERAQLQSLLARQKLAEQSLQRTQQLVASDVSTPAELDADEASVRSVRADVEAVRAQIDRKTVRAPFSGTLGIRAVNLGQYLAPGTPLTVLESTRSVFVDFTLPQQDLPKLHLNQPVRIRGEPKGPLLAQGNVSAFDASVDPVTRTIRVRASVPNDEGRLRTGMFANVEVLLPETSTVAAVPVTALVHAAFGDSVFVIEPKPDSSGSAPAGPGPAVEIARQQFVRPGSTRGDFVSIEEGVRVGERVVTAGAFKLRNGSPVVVKNEVIPQPELDPRPPNR